MRAMITCCVALALLAPAMAAQDGKSGDVIVTTAGASIGCKVLRISEGGLIHLEAPFLQGEARALVSHVRQIGLAGAAGGGGADYLVVTNGDRIAGSLESITEDAVVMKTDALGTVRIPLKVAQSVTRTKTGGLLLNNDFAVDSQEPWSSLKGSWRIKDGALTGTGARPYAVSARLQQNGPLTLEVKIDAVSNGYYCDLMLMADNTANQQGQNSLMVRFSRNQVRVAVVSGGRYQQHAYGQADYLTKAKQVVLQVAFDPGKGNVHVWADSQLLGEYNVLGAPAKGNFVIIRCNQPHRIRHIRVHSGMVAPPAAGADGEPDAESVVLANGDRFTASSLTLSEGTVVARTALGELRFPAAEVARIVTRKSRREVPRRRQGDVRVHTRCGIVTLALENMTAEHLVGESDYMGRVRISRGAIGKIEFDIYRGGSGAAGGDKSATSDGSIGPRQVGPFDFVVPPGGFNVEPLRP